MIVFDECDHCGLVVAGRKSDVTYSRADGDTNVLCPNCLRNQYEEDFKREEDREKDGK